MLEDFAVFAMAGASSWTTRQYMHLRSTAQLVEHVANKKLQATRNKNRENDENEERSERMPLLRCAQLFQSFSAFVHSSVKETYFPEKMALEPAMQPSRPGTGSALTALHPLKSASRADMAAEVLADDNAAKMDSCWGDMEASAFVLDCATSAMLILAHKRPATGALELLNLCITKIYGVAHMSLLDEYQSLAPSWSSSTLSRLEPRLFAFAAFIALERWREHQKTIREWALEAR